MAPTNLPQVPQSSFPQVEVQLCPLMAEIVERVFAKYLPLPSKSSYKERSSHAS